MKKINFTTIIDANPEKVWSALWDDKNYRDWTSVFSEGSYAESDWKEGSRILFLSPRGGMFSVIEKLVPQKEMVFKHMGEIKDGKEIPTDWAGAHESYYLNETNGMTELKAEMDATDEFAQFFKDTFPKALERVKQIAESL